MLTQFINQPDPLRDATLMWLHSAGRVGNLLTLVTEFPPFFDVFVAEWIRVSEVSAHNAPKLKVGRPEFRH